MACGVIFLHSVRPLCSSAGSLHIARGAKKGSVCCSANNGQMVGAPYWAMEQDKVMVRQGWAMLTAAAHSCCCCCCRATELVLHSLEAESWRPRYVTCCASLPLVALCKLSAEARLLLANRTAAEADPSTRTPSKLPINRRQKHHLYLANKSMSSYPTRPVRPVRSVSSKPVSLKGTKERKGKFIFGPTPSTEDKHWQHSGDLIYSSHR